MPELPEQPSAAHNIYVFGTTSFLNDTASEMAYWVLPAFLASLGAGPAQLGLIEGIAESVASFAKLFSGYLTDRIDRRKPVVVAGYLAANAIKPLLALATSWVHILLIRFTDRLAKGVRGAPRDVLVAGSVPKNLLGSPYALIQSMDSPGAVAVPFFSLGNSSDMVLVLRAQNVGIRVVLAPLLGLVFNITYSLASWPAGWFSDRVSRRMVGSVGYVIFAAVYFVFGRAPSTLAIWIAMAVYGLYNALTQPVLKALVVETVGESVRGRALGIYFFATSVATLAASLITGELWKHYGAAIPFYFSAALALVAAGLLQGARGGK